MRLRTLLYAVIVLLVCGAVFAQSTGAISGKVTSEGQPLPGVTVEARSNVLPQPRVTTTDNNGQFSLPALVPGTYTLSFSLSGMQNVTRRAEVLLGQTTSVDVTMGVQGVSESITVTAEASLVDKTSTQIETGITQKEIEALPVLQNYGDLQKLIPGVMYTQDAIRGPSAGASGQDNVYMFDGVNITMPLFGVLNTQPNTHDIAQVNVVKGGAKAMEFNRAGGFQIDSVSKSGTNKFSGELSYQTRPASFVADQVGTRALSFDQDRSWASANIGGPILPDRLFFYGSYYRPEFKRSNQANVYGNLPEYSLKTNEEFVKLTFTPLQSLLINGSYRHNKTKETSNQFSSFQAGTTGSGSETKLQLGTVEASWIINPRSFATAKFTDFRNPGAGTADFTSNAQVSTAVGTQLPLNDLSNAGRFFVPTPIGGNTAQNEFVQPFIEKYGYVCPQNAPSLGLTCTPGARTGGGTVGFGEFARDDDSFYRKAGQIGFNYTLGSTVAHDLHFGYQRYEDSEDRFQTSNGWGQITIPAGVGSPGTICAPPACATSTPAHFIARFSQQTGGRVPVIHSEFHSQNIELNDTIRWSNYTFNAGVLASNDTLYGQGLAKADNVAGFVASPGTKYKMHSFSFGDMLQPRLGATWAYNGNDTVWTSYARYYPAANSDARAASWDRNLVAQINAYFDATGKLIGVAPNAGSSGKWWQEGIKPPHIDEYMIGTGRQLTPRWSARLYTRYRHGVDYMEDTNNNARTDFNAPSPIPHEPYVPNLGKVGQPGTIRGDIGSGSSYVIANLDGAFTKYYEATLESEWRGDKLVLNGSYTWSHYYGNFDQDNTSVGADNDAARFIGSSNIGDSAGRQLWDMKYGDLRGDRRNVVKTRATYFFPWHASVGAFGVYQSGQPYQLESVLPYRAFTTSSSDTNRYAEPAGSRRSPAYYDIDLNYTQNFPLRRGLNVQLAFDIFNLTDNQEGYNYETRIGTLGIKQIAGTDKPYTGPTVPIPSSIADDVVKKQVGSPANFDRANYAVAAPFANSHYAPRRYQIALRLQF